MFQSFQLDYSVCQILSVLFSYEPQRGEGWSPMLPVTNNAHGAQVLHRSSCQLICRTSGVNPSLRQLRRRQGGQRTTDPLSWSAPLRYTTGRDITVQGIHSHYRHSHLDHLKRLGYQEQLTTPSPRKACSPGQISNLLLLQTPQHRQDISLLVRNSRLLASARVKHRTVFTVTPNFLVPAQART